MRRVTTVVDSPVGPLQLVGEDGALVGLHLDAQRHRPDPTTFGERDDAAFGPVVDQLTAYFGGELTSFDLPLAPHGTLFQQRVWAALREIPFACTESYGELATRIGTPGASRAVGLANGRNPIAIVIPCHRVIGANGTLTGYGGGLERKQLLLDLEARHAGLRLV